MDPKKSKTRQPHDNPLSQQRLRSCQTTTTPKTAFPIFLAIGIIFIPIGTILLIANNNASELRIDYTNCNSTATDNFEEIPDQYVKASFSGVDPEQVDVSWKKELVNITFQEGANATIPRCFIKFNIPTQLNPPVYIYYGLTGFYQNHRRYYSNYDKDQLEGKAITSDQFKDRIKKKSGCDHPFIQGSGHNNYTYYYPCGGVANSIFNDTIYAPHLSSDDEESLRTLKASASAKMIPTLAPTIYPFYKDFLNLTGKKYDQTSYQYDEIVPPQSWQLRYPKGQYSNKYPPRNLQNDTQFIIWMSTAGLPTFRKLYGMNPFDTMSPGLYQMEIDMLYPVDSFSTKSVIISNPVLFNLGKNPFLGTAYITVGVICIVVGILLLVSHIYKPRSVAASTTLAWHRANRLEAQGQKTHNHAKLRKTSTHIAIFD